MTESRRVLVVGQGAREHALAWKLTRDGAEVLVAPGNAGTAAMAENVPVPAGDVPALVALARDRRVDLAVIGPEAPLVAGVVDAFRAAGLRAFGPTAAAARLEGSKSFCKQILHRGDVPTAMYRVFNGAARARDYVEAREDMPMVVKADGLAAGKGVFVCDGREAALEALAALGSDPQFAAAAGSILIEERLDGVEVSVMAITDGRTIVTLPPLQDHKAAYDDDAGPNTGGMGAYCPAAFVDADLMAEIEARILVPTVHAMRRAKVPFVGVLYAGLMLTAQGPKVLEYNVRFGDPECQVLMLRLKSDALDLLEATARGTLKTAKPEFSDEVALTVVLAAKGYPVSPETGSEIRGLNGQDDDKLMVFHAGTLRRDGKLIANGGRVLNVTALGRTVGEARDRAYAEVDRIEWPEGFCRRDIGWRAVERELKPA